MATAVPPKPDAAARYERELEEHLAQATRRIRLNDVLTGTLLLLAIVLGYTAGMIAVDRWVDVPAWGRQLGLVGLIGVLGGVGYLAVLRPLRRMVNPLFAAKQVEETVPDAKNSIVNYVDLHDAPLPASIRAAVGAKAARQLQEADLNEAFESRRLIWSGAAVAVLVIVLAALFLVFRPAPFFSLLGRTLSPFSSGAIATRTEITITEPAGGDVTVTAGQAVKIAVTVNGRVPDPAGPARLRVLLRHNPADPNAEEVPLEPAGSNREWQARIPDHLVQNGFWYTVAGGDAVTPEHQVRVRSRPLFTAFEARYEYPAYLRLKPEVVNEPQLDGYRGTQVALTARANRELKSGRMDVAGVPDPIPGEVVGDARDAVRFRLTLAENGSYRLSFIATTGEQNADSPPYPIRVISDQPPTVTITAPADEQVVLPANGRLAVDGIVGDDFGIDSVTLRLRLADGGGRVLQPKPYQDGKSLRRDTDGTFPTTVEYKDSVPLAGLKDEAGRPVVLAEGMILEYWLEAVDNCTVPQPNLGKSRVQRVRLAAPATEPAKQQEQKQQADQRQQAEAKHQQEQGKKFQNERRDPPAQPHADAEKQPGEQGGQPDNKDQHNQGDAKPGEQRGGQKGDGQKAEGTNQPGEKGGSPQPNPQGGDKDSGAPKPAGGSDKGPEQKAGPENRTPPEAQPDANPGQKAPGDAPQPENRANDPAQPKPADKPDPKKADELKKEAIEINRKAAENQDQPKPGEARGADGQKSGQPQGADQPKPEPNQPAAESKTNPGQDAAPPAEPKAGDGGNQSASAQPKQPGKTPQPPAASEPKGTPSQKPEPGQPGDAKPGEPEAKQPPVGGSAGAEKPAKPEPKPGQDPGSAAQPKPADARGAGGDKKPSEQRKPEPGQSQDPMGQAGKPEPGSKAPAPTAKPKQPGTEERGEAKPAPDGKDQSGAAGEQPPAAAKGEKPTPPAEPKGGAQPQPRPGANSQGKPGDKPESAPSQAKPDAKPDGQPMGGSSEAPASAKGDGEKSGQPAGGGAGKPGPKEIEQARKDLASGDPQKEEAGRDTLEKSVGREQADELAKGMKSNDPAQRDTTAQRLDRIKKDAEKLSPENVRPDPNGEPEHGVERLMRDVKDLNSADPEKRKQAEDKLDNAIGKKNREDIQKKMKENEGKAGDPKQEAETKNQVEEMAKNHKNQGGNGKPRPDQKGGAGEKATAKDGPPQGSPDKPQTGGGGASAKQPSVDQKEMQEAVKDLASTDPEKQKAARKKLDQTVGPDARKQAEDMMNGLKSDDPKQREAAQKKLDELNQKNQQAGGGQSRNPEPTAEQKKELADAAKDLASGDPKKQQAARDKLDKMVGPDARKEAEQMAKDLQSGDPDKKAAAQKKLDELSRKNQQAGGDQPQNREPTAEQKKELADAAKDLASGDPKKKQAARDKLDKMVGQDARKEAELMAKDLQSGDPDKKAGAQKKFDDLQKQAAQKQPQKGMSPEEKQKLDQIAKDMASKDPVKQKEAAEKFGDTQLAKDLAEGLKRQAENMKNQDQNPNAKDPQKELEAGKNLADLAKQMEDLKSGDPQKAEQAMKDLKDLAEKMKGRNPPRGGTGDPDQAVGRGAPGNPADAGGTPLKGNDEFSKLPADLQLQKLKDLQKDPERLKKIGYTPEDYKRFLEGFENVVKQEQARKDDEGKRPENPFQGAPKVNVGEATSKVETRRDGTGGNAQGTGPAYAPPGYSEAQKKFAEGASKVRRGEKK